MTIRWNNSNTIVYRRKFDLSRNWIYNFYIFPTRCCYRSLIFLTINAVRSNSLSLRYQRFTPSDCKDIGIGKFEFVVASFFKLRKSPLLRTDFYFTIIIILFIQICKSKTQRLKCYQEKLKMCRYSNSLSKPIFWLL